MGVTLEGKCWRGRKVDQFRSTQYQIQTHPRASLAQPNSSRLWLYAAVQQSCREEEGRDLVVSFGQVDRLVSREANSEEGGTVLCSSVVHSRCGGGGEEGDVAGGRRRERLNSLGAVQLEREGEEGCISSNRA